MIKAVIFDLDDTLISEEDYIRSGYQAVAMFISEEFKMEKNTVYQQLYELYKTGSKKVFNDFFEINDIIYDRKMILELVAIYRNHKPEINFYSDVKKCLEKLRNKGILLGIISDGYLETQNRKAEVLGLDKLVDRIVFTDSLGKEYWKPNKYSYELMKEYFDISYEEMVYIGDNPEKDFYVKKEIPIKTIRIMRNIGVYKDKAYLEGVKEDFRIYTLDELFTIEEIKL